MAGAGLLVLAACSSGGGSSAPTSTTAPASGRTTSAPVSGSPSATARTDPASPPFVAGQDGSHFAGARCPMVIPATVTAKVDCGYLTVPENRLDPKSRMIKLAVARIHSSAPHPAADPVVQLEGGPGYASLASIGDYAQSSLLATRDLILWDQRGVGFSTPSLDCPETDEAVWQAFATTDAAKAEGARIDRSLLACRARLVRAGVDLGGYDTIQNADDLADLRVGMGIASWDLRGVSYGSALAIEEVRSHPEGIRSVLLDSVVTPDRPFGAVARGESALHAFAQLRQACAADRHCHSTYGDSDTLMARAAAALDRHPDPVTITDPDTGRTRHVQITGDDLYAGLFNAMYDATLIPAIPSVLAAIAKGDDAIVATLASSGIPFVTDQYEAMTSSMDCADHQRLLDPPSLDRFVAAHPQLGSLVYLEPDETVCSHWGVPSVPASFNRILTQADAHGIPILVMAGRFDPITPPAGTMRQARALGTKALLFPNSGHGAVSSSECAKGIYRAFLDHPAVAPDTSCMATLGPPDFA